MSLIRPFACRGALLAAVGMALLLMAGCAGGASGDSAVMGAPASADSGAGDPSDDSADDSGTDSTDTKGPQVGECRDYDFAAVAGESEDSAVVDCGEDHTAYTYEVGTLETKDELIDAGTDCTLRLASELGIDSSGLGTVLADTVFFRPDDDAWAAGERWYRCDLTAIHGGSELLDLPARPIDMMRPDANPIRAFQACLRPSDKAPVRCSDSPERYDFASGGYFDLAGEVTDDTIFTQASKTCRKTAGNNWYATWPSVASWEAGLNVIWCWKRS